MDILFANFAKTTLANPVSNVDTSITLAAGTGALYPSPTGAEFFALVVTDAATKANHEVMYVTARSGDVLTVTRGEEGTSAGTWIVGDICLNAPTAGTIGALAQLNGAAFTGACTFASTVGFSGVTTVPTQSAGNSTTRAASTAFVQQEKKVRQVVAETYLTQFSGSSYIYPPDGSVPQISEGKEFFAKAFTPTAADSIINVSVWFYGNTSDNRPVVAFFKDATANALKVFPGGCNNDVDTVACVPCSYDEVAASTSARTYRAHVAASGVGGGDIVSINRGITTANPYGAGNITCLMIITEYAP